MGFTANVRRRRSREGIMSGWMIGKRVDGMDGLIADAKEGRLAGRGGEAVTGIGGHAGYVGGVVEGEFVVCGIGAWRGGSAAEGELELGGGRGDVVDSLVGEDMVAVGRVSVAGGGGDGRGMAGGPSGEETHEAWNVQRAGAV